MASLKGANGCNIYCTSMMGNRKGELDLVLMMSASMQDKLLVAT